jgi:HD-GYP domain-containing protein (c-di-GMP phosphodiesterase class II)
MLPISVEGNLLLNLLEKLADFQPADRLQHSQSVARLSATLARLMDRNDDEIHKVYMGGLLHDIGKQFVPENVLVKPDKLTDGERDQVERHPWRGYVYLNPFVSDPAILNTVLYHHERWNGSGYPYRLVGEEIPIEARICAVADVWDALVSDRCYRSAWNVLQASDLISAGAGSLFDPDIVPVLMELIKEGYLERNLQENPITEGIGFRNSTWTV